jgi:hypothetical protein
MGNFFDRFLDGVEEAVGVEEEVENYQGPIHGGVPPPHDSFRISQLTAQVNQLHAQLQEARDNIVLLTADNTEQGRLLEACNRERDECIEERQTATEVASRQSAAEAENRQQQPQEGGGKRRSCRRSRKHAKRRRHSRRRI